MKAKDVSKLIGASESTTIEWKPSLSQMSEIIESVAAFANTEGGHLFIGVSREGAVTGISIGKDTIENLANRIAQHTEPKMYPRISVIKVSGVCRNRNLNIREPPWWLRLKKRFL